MSFHQSWVPNYAHFWSRKWISYSGKPLDFQACPTGSSSPWFGAMVQHPQHPSTNTSIWQKWFGVGAQPSSPWKYIWILKANLNMELYDFYRLDLSHCIHGIQGRKLKNTTLPVQQLEYHWLKNYYCFVWKLKWDITISFMYTKTSLSLLQILFYWDGDDSQRNFQQQNIFFHQLLPFRFEDSKVLKVQLKPINLINENKTQKWQFYTQTEFHLESWFQFLSSLTNQRLKERLNVFQSLFSLLYWRPLYISNLNFWF